MRNAVNVKRLFLYQLGGGLSSSFQKTISSTELNSVDQLVKKFTNKEQDNIFIQP